jgi:hypothetical protein
VHAQVQALKETIEMDLVVMRGWVDGGGGGRAGVMAGRFGHRGLLRVSVDALTVRQSAKMAENKYRLELNCGGKM